MQNVINLYNNGHEDFRIVCSIARIAAQGVAFPDDNSIFAFKENMAYLERAPFWRDYAIGQIEKVCNGIYFRSSQEDSSHLADVIPFLK